MRKGVLGWALLAMACVSTPKPTGGPAAQALRRAELEYQGVREVEDAIDVAQARGADTDGLRKNLDGLRWNASTLLGRIPPTALSEVDVRALGTMLRHLESVSQPGGPKTGESPVCPIPDGWPDPKDPGAFDNLAGRLYRCFGARAGALTVEGEGVDRLTILGRLSKEESAALRKRLFMGLRPIWEVVNGDNSRNSPYRRLVQLAAAELARQSSTAERKVADTLGIPSESLEAWLVEILEKWRATTEPGGLEPWDVWFQGGAAGRSLDARISRRSLRPLNDSFYRSLGADVEGLGLKYDLDPRPGKTPVAFTTFGRRNQIAGKSLKRGEFWIFATYREGGLGNLGELLHETGHGIHIAAIDTRPAFQDWPDNDTFTEALADLAALEIYEPEWQREFLGTSAPLALCMRSKYAPIVLDVAWGLFELRMLRDPEQDPNRLWTDLTGRYLGVLPHPELSWWALRGQLVESPGYMLNYAVGAALIADIRERVQRELGPFWKANPDWYPWVSARLFRFGKERSSGEVLRDFLGRPPNPQALLADMNRLASK